MNSRERLIRLFVAIDLPGDVKDQLDELCVGVSGVKWVGRAQMHLTLRFIGEVTPEQSRTIQTALAGITCEPFTLTLQGVGQFPPKGSPRVLWVGVNAPRTLHQLAALIETALRGTGLDPADHPFSPHITLARVKAPPPPEAVNQFFRKHDGFQTGTITVDRFLLMSSILAREGPTYRVERAYPLQPKQDEP